MSGLGRRDFLGMALAAPLAAAHGGVERRLIVIELAGGNDGLNTVIPYRNDAYYRARPTLAIKRPHALRLTDEIGLHPSLIGLKRLWDAGQLAIVQGCGYPNPNRDHLRAPDHFKAMEVWHTASPDRQQSYGWLGRLADCLWADDRDAMATAAERAPLALESRRHAPVCRQADLGGARIYYGGIGGFDTHAAQAPAHNDRLAALSAAIEALSRNPARNVAVMIFTEFGRRPEENAAGGTDHGTAAPVFVLGENVRGGLYGSHPSLTDLDPNGDLRMTVDFRRVYASIIAWMGARDAGAILEGGFEPLPLFTC